MEITMAGIKKGIKGTASLGCGIVMLAGRLITDIGADVSDFVDSGSFGKNTRKEVKSIVKCISDALDE